LPDDLAAWIGKTETRTDTITPRQAELMAATLDYDAGASDAVLAAGVVPPLWHWMAFLPDAPMSDLGPDGHAKRGGFLPPVPLERRMWAGGRLVFHRPAPLGAPIERRSEILAIKEKTGGSGRLVFVTVAHRISGPDGLAIEEEHDIVYIAIPEVFSPPPPKPAPEHPTWAEDVPIDSVRLFRYSALTFNGHRIHYDLDYSREHEKYPGLVVHGPLQATLMVEAARRNAPGREPGRFSFRGVRPLFHFETMQVIGHSDGDGTAVHAVNGDGLVTMQGRMDWA
jgi:3-methylfumaryl-CoA hydratase